ncbi:MAG: helix-turn-helix domain-containing protein [Pseudonocardia sp.]
MTQAQLASAVSLDRSVLAKIETGQRRVGALELALVAEALDERVEWFVTEAPQAIVSHRNLQEPGTPSPSIDRIIERATRSVKFVQENGDLVLLALGLKGWVHHRLELGSHEGSHRPIAGYPMREPAHLRASQRCT